MNQLYCIPRRYVSSQLSLYPFNDTIYILGSLASWSQKFMREISLALHQRLGNGQISGILIVALNP